MYVDIVISNIFHLNKHFFFSFIFSVLTHTLWHTDTKFRRMHLGSDAELKHVKDENIFIF